MDNNVMEYVIVRQKTDKTPHFYLADYDNVKHNTVMWSRDMGDAFIFDKYKEAEAVVKWLAALKIIAKIDIT